MSNEIANQTGGSLSERPSFISEIPKDDYGTGVLQNYVSPPFIKIVQSNSKEPYNNYSEGTVLAVPLNMELFAPGQIFHVTPIFFFSEYVLTNPFTLKHLPFIRERTFDGKSELAAKCRDFQNRSVVCPEAPADKQENDKFKCTYYEHLNYVCVIWEHDVFRETPIIFTFRSSEFKTGRKLAGLISMRDAPICALRFAGHTAIHQSSGNENYGINWDNPNPDSDGGMSPWLDQPTFEKYNVIHKRFKEAYDTGELQPSYEEDSRETSSEPEGTPAM